MENLVYNEKNGLWYAQQGDYYFPCLTMPNQGNYEIGIWGYRRKQYLKQHHRVLYYNLLTSCKLLPHLADVDQRAEAMFDQLVRKISQKEGITEKLKADNMMLWVQKMNNIRDRVTEIINSEIIYA